MSLRAPLPGTLRELREQRDAWQQLAASDWLCTAIPLVEQRAHGHQV